MATSERSKQELAYGSYGAHLTTGCTIIGDLSFDNAARIDGRVDGGIVATGHHLIIGETAEVNAHIEAVSVVILGRVTGDIKAKRIEIGASAKIAGNLSSPTLVVEPGAILDGLCFMPSASSIARIADEPEVIEAQVIVLTDPIESANEHAQEGSSLFITRRQRVELHARGYDDAAIDRMSPNEAQRILGIN
jgi:cytoskeletal protein CcmA (bactofilin family)